MSKKAKIQPKNSLIAELSSISIQCPRAEKILIMPNYQTGRQVLENLVRSGTPWINFRVKTVESLATEIMKDALIEEGLERLSSVGIQLVVDSVFNDLADSKKLKYFEKHPVNKGMVEALTRTVQELRVSGSNSSNLRKGCFLSPAKENDIRLILSEYEKALKDKKLVDTAGIIEMAIANIGKNKEAGDCKYLIFSRHYMRGIEKEFVEKLCGKDLVIIKEDPVFGLDKPADMWPVEDAAENPKCDTNIERLKWLFGSKKSPPPFKDGTIDIFSAIGYRTEIRETLRRIAAGKIKVDEAEIIYTDRENYANLIHSLCEKMDIPVTFSEGLEPHIAASGRAMMGFLLWIKEDFGESYLRRVFESGGLEWKSTSEPDMPGSSTLAYLLRTSGVGWGRDRYGLALTKRIEECIASRNEFRVAGEEDSAIYKEKKAKNLTILKNICEELLGFVPEKTKDNKIEFTKLCDGCSAFLGKYVKILDDNDAAFVESTKERLVMLGSPIEGKMLFEEAMEKLINTANNIRVGASRPQPGCLHVSHYRNGGLSGRANTFIVGLNDNSFPEKIGQDPVLLDEERQKISVDLELSTDKLKKSVYSMASLVSGLRGKLTASFSSYDIKENRKSFPSSLVLQIFRIKEGNPAADYNMLFEALGEPIGFTESPTTGIKLDETDWWLNKLVDKGILKDGLDAVQRYYKGLREGLAAKVLRSSNKFTKYDGKVMPAGGELDPRENKDMVMSCSRLEAAAKCPFVYFIENILHVREPDEVEKDVTEWLDSAERGNLLHEVFQVFINKVRADKNITIGSDEGKDVINKILDDIVKKYKEDIPPPSEIIFENEYAQLKRDVSIFLKISKDLATTPIGSETCFGENKKDAVNIPLGNGKNILLRGKIDRIDLEKPSIYHVWDYKTGSSYSYNARDYIVGGEQIQHALYAVAAEEILKKSGKDKNPNVTQSGYLLPTEKGTRDGKGGIFPRSTAHRERWQAALNKLLDVIGSGAFIVGEGDTCSFCDYGDICGGTKTIEEMKAKLKNEDNKELEAWKELKEYE